ncbi:von Willebrand factor A [Hyphomonas johnsonii MHS-2]|uniref:von Willebrand factor A n=2 Tax=Hyphomonas johnsonii TaxID=81031 RepID=A0A059FTW6_9PROT|nr:von Willebrand factor A [Hyphomonas johnsonii MHS-2]
MRWVTKQLRNGLLVVAFGAQISSSAAWSQVPDLSKLGGTSEVPALESTPLEFVDGLAEVKLKLVESTVYHFDVTDTADIYKLSAEAAEPVSIVLEANTIELNERNQPTARTKLLSDSTRGFGDRTARLPATTFKPGRIYLGLAPLNPVDVTLTVERIVPVQSPASLPNAPSKALPVGNDVSGPANGETHCMTPALLSANKVVDLALVSAPTSSVEMYVYSAKANRAEARSGKGSLAISGIRLKDSAVCVRSRDDEETGSWRLVAEPSQYADGPIEPNSDLKYSTGPSLSIGQTYTMPLDARDEDRFSLAKLAGVGAASVHVISAVNIRLCLRETNKVVECLEGRDIRFSPFRISKDTVLTVVNHSYFGGLYELTLERLTANPQDTVFEPNSSPGFQPIIEGAFRIQGALSTSDDTDTIGFNTGDVGQLWRIMVLGESVGQIELSNARGKIADIRRHGGNTRRLVAPDVYLEPGPVYISIYGTPGDYKVIAKPLGSPRADSEREPNENVPRRLSIGQPIIGVSPTGDDDRFSMYLPRNALVEMSIDVPPGSEYYMTFSVASDDASASLDRQIIKPGGWKRTVSIPAGEHELRIEPRTGSPAEYKLSARYANPFPVTTPSALKLAVTRVAEVSAYSIFRQRVTAVLNITNTSTQPVSGTLDFWFARSGIEVIPYSVSLAAGESTTKVVSFLLPDDLYDGDLPFFVAVRTDKDAIVASTEHHLKVGFRTAPVGAIPARRVPPALAGGINVARTSLGAQWLESGGISVGEDGDYARGNPAGAGNLLNLIDGFITQGTDHEGLLSGGGQQVLSPVLDLPGDKPIPIAGIGINTRLDAPQGILGFAIDVSSDGKKWREVLVGAHEEWGQTAYYAFPGGPADALKVRLRATDRRGGDASRVSLSGFEVIARPGHSGLNNLNIADKELGALVSGNRKMQANRHLQIDAAEGSVTRFPGDMGNPTDFNNAITFRNQLEADIEAVEAVYPATFPDDGWPFASAAIVSASAYGPIGPFHEIGRFDLPAQPQPNQTIRYELPEWSSARAVKVEYEHPESAYFLAPMIMKFIERPEDETYRSALGTWGEFATAKTVAKPDALDLATMKQALASVHEWLDRFVGAVLGKERNGTRPDVTSDPGHRALVPGSPLLDGSVEFGVRTDTWRVPAEGQTNRLKITARGSAGFDPAVSARDSSGNETEPIEIVRSPLRPEVTYTFDVTPGSFLDVEISEPQRSVVFLIDQSASIASQIPQIRRAIIDFADDMVTGRDAVQFKSFGGDWARDDWITDPETLRPLLANYNGGSNSAGESSLLDAAKLLENREGSRAIVVITDGDVDTKQGLVEALHAARARVFAVKTPSNSTFQDPSISQPRASFWAGQTGGEVSLVLQSEDISVAYARVAARLLGPKPYSVSAQGEVVVLKPGFLQVDAAMAPDPKTTVRSQLIILDASGSMLKRLGDRRRIDIAKAALAEYLNSQLARSQAGEQLNVGLRVFGGEPSSCDTDLIQPVTRFDNDRLASSIKSVRPQNNAKTAIGAALLAAAKDLQSVTTPASASILLITDGEETCGGFPLQAIQSLKAAGIEARIDVVSYALEPEVDRRPFEAWAKAGGGIYVDAADGADLENALANTSRVRFTVYQDGERVASGTSGGDPIELVAGKYDLHVDGMAPRQFVITASKTTKIVPN